MQVPFSGDLQRCHNTAGAMSSFICLMVCGHGMAGMSSVFWNFLDWHLAGEQLNLTRWHDRSALNKFWTSASRLYQKVTRAA